MLGGSSGGAMPATSSDGPTQRPPTCRSPVRPASASKLEVQFDGHDRGRGWVSERWLVRSSAPMWLRLMGEKKIRQPSKCCPDLSERRHPSRQVISHSASNPSRPFWTCASTTGHKCGFFAWVDPDPLAASAVATSPAAKQAAKRAPKTCEKCTAEVVHRVVTRGKPENSGRTYYSCQSCRHFKFVTDKLLDANTPGSVEYLVDEASAVSAATRSCHARHPPFPPEHRTDVLSRCSPSHLCRIFFGFPPPRLHGEDCRSSFTSSTATISPKDATSITTQSTTTFASSVRGG